MIVRPFRSLSMSVCPIIYVESITFNHLLIQSNTEIYYICIHDVCWDVHCVLTLVRGSF